ncbi:MAG: hypothetical protein R3F19_15065 [Verrucomicrobiales bacterium]
MHEMDVDDEKLNVEFSPTFEVRQLATEMVAAIRSQTELEPSHISHSINIKTDTPTLRLGFSDEEDVPTSVLSFQNLKDESIELFAFSSEVDLEVHDGEWVVSNSKLFTGQAKIAVIAVGPDLTCSEHSVTIDCEVKPKERDFLLELTHEEHMALFNSVVSVKPALPVEELQERAKQIVLSRKDTNGSGR